MNGTVTIGIEHNFETAHRLPFLEGKCKNLHGHSWITSIAFRALPYETGMDPQGISTEYGNLKKIVRGWIDEHLDHGCMLGAQDPLVPTLLDASSKVFIFGDLSQLYTSNIWIMKGVQRWSSTSLAEVRNYAALPWPTVEAVGRMIAEKIQALVSEHLLVESVLVMETSVNSALWTPEGRGSYRFDRMSEEYPEGPYVRTETMP